VSLPIEESWRPIPGYEGNYEVSDLGRVRSLDRVLTCGSQRRRFTGQILSQFPNGEGRPTASINRDGRPRRVLVHRLVLLAFVGEPPAGHVACHNDGDCTNNRLSNLRWDTERENQLDIVRHGRHWSAQKTHCPQGHAYAGSNLVTGSRGGRACRTCRNAGMRERYRARVAAARAATEETP